MEQLSTDVRTRIDAYWSSFFGVEPDHLRPRAAVVVPHAQGLRDYVGIYAQSFGAAPLISVPPQRLGAWERGVGDAESIDLERRTRWDDLEPEVETTIGPAWLGYADAPSLTDRAPIGTCRQLEPGDAALVDDLQRACSPVEWEHGGFASWENPVVAVMSATSGTAITAVAAVGSYEPWGDSIAHLSIITHPAHRGRGYARVVVAALARVALASGLIPQYRTLIANAPSLAVAQATGFRPYAVSLALRMRSSPVR